MSQMEFDLPMPSIKPLEAAVLACVRGCLGSRVPTYVRRVVSIEPGTWCGGSLIADIVVFDGRRARVEFAGTPKEALSIRWHSGASKANGGPFGWNGRRWRRYQEDAE